MDTMKNVTDKLTASAAENNKREGETTKKIDQVTAAQWHDDQHVVGHVDGRRCPAQRAAGVRPRTSDSGDRRGRFHRRAPLTAVDT